MKDTIDYFYQYDRAHVKFSPVYMSGKGNYNKFTVQKQIKQLMSQYAGSSKTSCSRVIYCFDCDDCDTKAADRDFLNKVRNYCREKEYDFVWFYKDIEGAYLERKVENNQKGAEAEDFKRKKLIANVSAQRLSMDTYQKNTSNILRVLDRYLKRKV